MVRMQRSTGHYTAAMESRWQQRAASLVARVRSSPRLLGVLFVGVAIVAVVGGIKLGTDLTRPQPTAAAADGLPEDDPEGFAAWLLGGADGADVSADQYQAAEAKLREQLAKQVQLEAQGDDRARVLRGLGATAQPWTWLGPRNYGGRTRAFVVSPTNPKVMLAGGITGGVWRSEDGGASWVPLTDTFSNISIGVLEIDPNNPLVIYAGTGEAYYRSWPMNRGNGIMKSTDGGTSWAFLDSTVRNDAFDWVGDIEVSHNDPKRVYAATGTGVWLSKDGGDSWGAAPVLASGNGPDSVGCLELAIRTDRNPDVVFASCGHEKDPDGVYQSSDGGASWQKVLPVDKESIGVAALAVAPNNQDIVYASVSSTGQDALGLYASTTGGGPGTWTRRASPASGAPNWLGNCRFPKSRGQGGYDNVIAVDPTNPDRLWVGGVDLFRSEDGGKSFRIASDWALDPVNGTPYVHADQHVIVFDPRYDGTTNRTVYFASDGGLYRNSDDRADLGASKCEAVTGMAYEAMNNGYGISQFVGGAVSDDGGIVIGGTQDNGTYRFDAGKSQDWVTIRGGDGGNSIIHPSGEWLLISNETFQFRRLTGAARTGESVACNQYRKSVECLFVSGDIKDEGLFYPPIERDPRDPGVIWSGGRKIWRSPDIGATWSPVHTFARGAASAIGIAPGDPNIVYVGTTAGGIVRTTNARDSSPTWSPLDGPFPKAQISSIAIDPADSSTGFVAVKAFEGQQLWRSVGGGPWEAIDGTLPDVPINALAINPRNTSMVYAGSDVGIFESLDRGSTWRVANENLATTIVNRLVFRTGTSELYAFTFGRGAYRVDVGDRSPPENDLRSAAKVVVLAPEFHDAIDIRSASIAADDPIVSCGSALVPTQTRSVWYRLDGATSGRVSVTTEGSNFDTVVAALAADAAGGLKEIECNDDSVAALGPSTLVFDAAAGTTYYIEVMRSASSPANTLANSLNLTISRP